MKDNYKEIYYHTNYGYYLFHLTGENAGNSTAKYLHHESELAIFYFAKGTGNVKIEGTQYDINEGDIIIINPHELYQLNVDANKYHERISLHTSEILLKYFPNNGSSIFKNLYKRKKGEHNRISAKIANENNLDKDFKYLLELARNPDPTNAILSICKITELLINLGRTILPQCPDEAEHIHESPFINDVIHYIRTHLRENISVKSISAHFNIGKSYLSHLFKEQVGISLWDYVIIRRIYLFNNIIKEGNSIEETCYKVGFKNYSNFFRLYKKHMKMTPTEFKKQMAANHKVHHL
ncbi:MAG: helix-turn-helix transcriptional regulator [Clostridia bacterium]|nr:helix-turn-helix transcriptional regulator [Clostridia bacterium]